MFSVASIVAHVRQGSVTGFSKALHKMLQSQWPTSLPASSTSTLFVVCAVLQPQHRQDAGVWQSHGSPHYPRRAAKCLCPVQRHQLKSVTEKLARICYTSKGGQCSDVDASTMFQGQCCAAFIPSTLFAECIMMEVSASLLLYESVLDCIVLWKAVPLTKPFTKEYAVRAMYARLLRTMEDMVLWHVFVA